MADFYQNIVPTFTRLDNEDLIQMEKSLSRAAARLPKFKDLSSDAMQNIIHELSSTEFIGKIYISLDRATPEEHREAQEITRPLRKNARVLWNDSPAVQSVIARIDQVLPVGPRGKGQAVWTALGYALGKGEVSGIAFHNADILTYDRGLLLRLLFPVVRLRYQFSKGFYARHSDRLHGRVVRLFYFPFVKTTNRQGDRIHTSRSVVMNPTEQPIHFAGATLGRCRHICAFFHSPEKEYRVFVAFPKGGDRETEVFAS